MTGAVLHTGARELRAGDPIAVLPALFHLMWRHALTADLAVRLTAETPVVAGTAPGGAC